MILENERSIVSMHARTPVLPISANHHMKARKRMNLQIQANGFLMGCNGKNNSSDCMHAPTPLREKRGSMHAARTLATLATLALLD